jgi:hypothetical protein
LKSVLHDMKYPRRVTRGEIQVRHDIPCFIAFPCSIELSACCGKSTVDRALANGQPPA